MEDDNLLRYAFTMGKAISLTVIRKKRVVRNVADVILNQMRIPELKL